MPFITLPTKAKNDKWGFQQANNIKSNFDYLNAQKELLIEEDGTELKDDVVPAAAMKASNVPTDGASLVARATADGGQTWEDPFESEVFQFFM